MAKEGSENTVFIDKAKDITIVTGIKSGVLPIEDKVEACKDEIWRSANSNQNGGLG